MKYTTFGPKTNGDRVKNLQKASPNLHPESLVRSTRSDTAVESTTMLIR